MLYGDKVAWRPEFTGDLNNTNGLPSNNRPSAIPLNTIPDTKDPNQRNQGRF